MNEPISKSQLKREMTALQELGERLCALSKENIKSMDISEELREAALFSKTIKKHEALRRHRQYIGKIMRANADDVEALKLAIDLVDQVKGATDDRFHQLEQWRDALMGGDQALLEEILDLHPDADRQRLRTLVRNAQKERAAEKPPKKYRELFKYLRQLQES